MIDNQCQKEINSLDIARKHVNICIEVKDIVNQIFPKYSVYIATHSKKYYKVIEKESENEFWSLKLYSTIDNEGKLKDPDIIVTEGEIVKYMIEVKWGAIKKCSTSDVEKILKNPEKSKIENARCWGKEFKIHGPFVKNGQKIVNEELKEWKYFKIDDNTKFILVTDLKTMEDVLPKKRYENILIQLQEQSHIFITADIHERVNDILSLREIIQLDY